MYNTENFLSITKTNKYYPSFKFQYQSVTKVFQKFIQIILHLISIKFYRRKNVNNL